MVQIVNKPDGSLLSTTIVTDSKQYSCPTVGVTLQQFVPATFAAVVSPAFNNSIGGKIARTEVLTGCAVGGTPTLTLGADGSAKLGSVSYTGNQISVVTDKNVRYSGFRRFTLLIGQLDDRRDKTFRS